MNYPLGYNTWSKEELYEANKVLLSGNYTMGKKVNQFEKKFSKYFGSKYAIMVNSGSSANLLMMSALRYFPKFFKKKVKKPNIIVPVVGWSTSYYPISQCGFEINFVDINKNSLNLDVNKINGAIDKNTVAILAINLLGNPCDFNLLKRVCEKKKLILLEDNCESLGSKFNNKFCGTLGLMGTHSLFFAHHMQTMEGGIILTDNKDLYDILRSLRAHGWCRDLPNRNNLYKKKNDSFKDKFTFITPGYALRPLEIQAAIGIVQLKKFKNFMKMRIKNAKIFMKLFGNKKWCTIQSEELNCESSWYGFNILLKGKLKNKRKKIINKLIQNKIEVRPTMTGNFTKNPVIKFLQHKINGDLKIAKLVDKSGFFLGNYPKNLENELNLVYKLISKEIK